MHTHHRLAMIVPIAGLIAVLAAAPTASAKPKPTKTATTTTVPTTTTTEPSTTTEPTTTTEAPTTTPTATPTTQTCWSPASEPVTVDTTWSASDTTESCTYQFHGYLDLLGKVMISTDAWIWFYEPAVDPTDPVAFSYAGIQWTLYSSQPNGIACGEAGSCDGVPLEEDPY